MGIIGVVAALTIPNLNSSTADKEKVAKLRKVYSNLNDAFGRAEAVYDPVEEWIQMDTTTTAQATRVGERLTEFMKISKNCGVTTNQHCFAYDNAIRGVRGANLTGFNVDNSSNHYKFQLADGSSVGLLFANAAVTFYVNIEGPIKIAKFGRNTFYLFANSTNGVDYPHATSMSYTNLLDCFGEASNTGSGITCTGWVLDYDNMDYLKADNVGKCPNGTVLGYDSTKNSCK